MFELFTWPEVKYNVGDDMKMRGDYSKSHIDETNKRNDKV